MTTRARAWVPSIAMMLVSVVSYVDRNTLALLAPTILGELRLSGEQYGWMVSCFSVAYTIGNPAWGRALDRVGIRRGMLVAVGAWTIASASHALVTSFAGFAIARALLGFGEGATFPAGLRAATQSLPPSRRARGIAIAYSGGSLGAILTPIVVTPIALAWGWRGAFLFTGALGAAWLALWIVVGRAVPAEDDPAPPAPDDGVDRVRARDPRLWAFVALYAMGGLPLGFVLYGAPLYLHDGLAQSQSALGRVLWLPPLAWEIGYFFWGWAIDRLGPRAIPRLAIGLAAAALPLAATTAIASVAWAMALASLATFAAAGFIIAGIAYAARVFTPRDSGLVAGIGAGSWSALVAVAMPWFGRLFDARAYAPAFVIAAIAPAIGVVAWRAIERATRATARS